jgi:hypothetical protein
MRGNTQRLKYIISIALKMVIKKDIDILSISFFMTPTGFEPVLPP